MTHSVENQLLYSRQQCSNLLNISVRTISRLIASGRIQTVSIGRRRLITRDQLLNIAGQDARTKLGL